MPFKPGKSGNPKGAPKQKHVALKWEEIDKDIAVAAKFVATVVDGTDLDLQSIEDPKGRLEMKLKAVTALLKLAPQRQAGEDGGPVTVIVKKF